MQSDLGLPVLSVFPEVVVLYFFFTGLRGIYTKKPFWLSFRWFWSLMLLGLWFPPVLSLFFLLTDSETTHLGTEPVGSLILLLGISLSILMILIVTGIVIWKVARQYIGYGLTELVFRESLIAALERLEIPVEEKLSGMYLPSIGANLRVGCESWSSTASLSIRPRKFYPILRDIVKAMTHYYQTTNVPVSFTGCFVSLILSILLLVVDVLLKISVLVRAGFFS